jgi:tetratricopeptide (TPR) repeat protein
MAEGALSIKLRCASWQQLATIYKRDLSHGTMFLRAATPPPVGTVVRIDLTLPSATVIALDGVVSGHVQDPQRGSGIELRLSPIPASSVWLIESALASETRRLATPVIGHPVTGAAPTFEVGPGAGPGASVSAVIPAIPIPAIHDHADIAVAEQDLIKALVSEAESLKKLSPFLVLGVGYEAGEAEIRIAFGELTKRYHPDRFARYESIELRQLAAEIFILIRDAYRRLGDAAGRAQVLQSLGKSTPAPRAIPSPSRTPSVPPPRATQRPPSVPGAPAARDGVLPTVTVPVPAVIRPPAAPRRPTGDPAAPAAPAPPTPPPPPTAWGSTPPPPGRSPASTPPPAAARGTGASPFARTQQAPVLPAALDPAELASLEDLIDRGRLDEALSGYRMLAKRHAHDRNVRAGVELCEGLLARAARDRLEAAQRFETALEIDPSNERAARELAEMRRQATNERKGLLSRLMGKKEP